MALTRGRNTSPEASMIRSPADEPTTPSGARLVVLGVLMACFAWAIIIPWSLTAPPTAMFGVIHAAALTGFGAAMLATLWSSATLRPSGVTTWLRIGQLVAAALVLWVPEHLWAEPDEHPWAWLAGFAIAACALLGWRAAVLAGTILTAAGMVGGQVFHSSIAISILITLVTAAGVWAMCHALVWMLRMLWESQVGREAQAELAIAQERLRVSRELHDVLGHRLSVIALKAELAADYATHDATRAAAESEEIRTLATETLRDARRVVHDQLSADLPGQLRAAQLVFGSAGIAVDIEAPADLLDRAPRVRSELMAAVVREAVTNVLRHSEATRVAISVALAEPVLRLTITNDGIVDSAYRGPSDGSGLAGLAARCAAQGAYLTVIQNETRFALCVQWPARTADSR